MYTTIRHSILFFQRLTLDRPVQKMGSTMRIVFVIVCLLCACGSWAATLEKLTTDEMSQKSTVIVRGRIANCAGDQRGSVIYTRCRVAVTERWKGTSGAQLEFFVPGGTARGLTQVFTGVPHFVPGSEYVLFLWAGKSGNLQVIGLSQGVFDVKLDGGTVKRPASTERMVNAAGEPVQDEGVEMTVAALKQRVQRALAGGVK
jgi:hypothetical protein